MYTNNYKGGKLKKIDIHSHILPGFDVGSSSEAESLRMLKMAAKQGVEAVIATPHYSAEYCHNSPETIRRACAELEARVREKINPAFRIYPGQEIMYTLDILEKLERGEILTLAGTSYVLVEFMPWVPYSDLYRCVRTLMTQHYCPVIAHIERYGALREKGRVEELTEIGALMQMNYRRIGGKWYEETTRWCRKMLKDEKIHFLATDMHNTKARKPSTQGAEVWMAKHLDSIYMKKLCYKNALKLIKQNTQRRENDKYGKYA